MNPVPEGKQPRPPEDDGARVETRNDGAEAALADDDDDEEEEEEEAILNLGACRKTLVFTNRDGTRLVPFRDLVKDEKYWTLLPAGRDRNEKLATLYMNILMGLLRSGRGFVQELGCRLKTFTATGWTARASGKELSFSWHARTSRGLKVPRKLSLFDPTTRSRRTGSRSNICAFSLHFTRENNVPYVDHVSWNGVHFSDDGKAEYGSAPFVEGLTYSSIAEGKYAACDLVGSHELSTAIAGAPNDAGRSLKQRSAAAGTTASATTCQVATASRTVNHEGPKTLPETQVGAGENARPRQGSDGAGGATRWNSEPANAIGPEALGRVDEAVASELNHKQKAWLTQTFIRSVYDPSAASTERKVQKMSRFLLRECGTNPLLKSAILQTAGDMEGVTEVADDMNPPITASAAEELTEHGGGATFASAEDESMMRADAPPSSPPMERLSAPIWTEDGRKCPALKAPSSLKRGRSPSSDRSMSGDGTRVGGNADVEEAKSPHFRLVDSDAEGDKWEYV